MTNHHCITYGIDRNFMSTFVNRYEIQKSKLPLTRKETAADRRVAAPWQSKRTSAAVVSPGWIIWQHQAVVKLSR
jgi:hypothetical protein